MDDIKNTVVQQDKPTVEQPEKTFTQEEVNRIVQDRLARDRAIRQLEPEEPAPDPKAEEMAAKEADLTKRENRLSCIEILEERKLNKGLLDILDTSDKDEFVKKLDALEKLYPDIKPDTKPRPKFTTPMNSTGDRPSPEVLQLKNVFGLKR